MKSKRLRFAENLVPLVLSGKKYVTWRMFDDKDLKVGDRLSMIDRGADKEFAQADIVNVYEKKFGEINVKDFVGHEEFNSREEMYKTYRGYYGDKVNDDTIIKIIKFRLIDSGASPE